MSEAHKTLCDDIYCEQFLCVQNRDAAKPMSKSQYRRIESQGGNALEMALSEIKALKAENEALKKRIDDAIRRENVMHETWDREGGFLNRAEAAESQVAAQAQEIKALREQRDRGLKLIKVLEKLPYTLSETYGQETLAAWEEYNGR
jgi:hypothetical protein